MTTRIGDGLTTELDQLWSIAAESCGWMLARFGDRRTLIVRANGHVIADICTSAPLAVNISEPASLAALIVAAGMAQSNPQYAQHAMDRVQSHVPKTEDDVRGFGESEYPIGNLAKVTADCVDAAREDGVSA